MLEEDLGSMYVLYTKHIPSITLSLYKKNGINIDLKEITQQVNEIYNEHFENKSMTDSILIAQLLLDEIYTKVQTEINILQHPIKKTERDPSYC